MLDLEAFQDPRLAGERTHDCFMCGQVVRAQSNLCFVQSPKAGGLKLAAHRTCVNGKPDSLVAARYQSALFAALTGSAERVH